MNGVEKENDRINVLYEELVAVRRRLHACPELDFDLKETAGIVGGQLDSLGIPWRFVAGTGIAALLEGKEPGRTVFAPGGHGCPARGGGMGSSLAVEVSRENARLRP